MQVLFVFRTKAKAFGVVRIGARFKGRVEADYCALLGFLLLWQSLLEGLLQICYRFKINNECYRRISIKKLFGR